MKPMIEVDKIPLHIRQVANRFVHAGAYILREALYGKEFTDISIIEADKSVRYMILQIDDKRVRINMKTKKDMLRDNRFNTVQ